MKEKNFQIAVLGAGMVGSAIALDLNARFNVTAFDINPSSLEKLRKQHIKTKQVDLSNAKNLSELIKPFDLIISAVPGFMGFNTLKTIIRSKKNVVDISFFPENAFELDTLAKKNNVIAVVDCGVAPGMSNFILGYYHSKMQISNFICYVGGLPVVREFPFEYKAPFSPSDVIEEYTRPARYVENFNLIVKEALSEPEYIFFENIGTLEAFNTDGLRTLIKTIKIPNMKEKTLRYPGHIQLIKALKEGGFFDTKEIKIFNTNIKPIDFTSQILFKKWKLEENDDEFTIMRIIIEGYENNNFKKIVYNLLDKKEPITKISSMARTTGYACTAVANYIFDYKPKIKGIIPPELLAVEKDCFDYVINYQKKRNINYIKQEFLI